MPLLFLHQRNLPASGIYDQYDLLQQTGILSCYPAMSVPSIPLLLPPMPLPLPGANSTRLTHTEVNKRGDSPAEAAAEQAAKRIRLDTQPMQTSTDVETAKRTILAYKALYPAEVGTFLDAYRPTPFDGLSNQSILLCAEGLEQKYHRGALPSLTKARVAESLDFDSDIAQAQYVLQSLDDLRPSQQYTHSHQVSV